MQRIAAECDALVTAYGHCGSCTTGTVRDGIAAARLGLPAVIIVIEEFRELRNLVAASAGMPDVPTVVLDQRMATATQAARARAAEGCAESVLASLEATR